MCAPLPFKYPPTSHAVRELIMVACVPACLQLYAVSDFLLQGRQWRKRELNTG